MRDRCLDATPRALVCPRYPELQAPVVVTEGEPVECYVHVMGDTYRMESATNLPSAPGWVLYLTAAPGQRLRLHLYFDDVDSVTRRALRPGRGFDRTA
jgi:hypothetical protein